MKTEYISKMLQRMWDEGTDRLSLEATNAERALDIVKGFPSPLKEELFVELILQSKESSLPTSLSHKVRAA